MSAAPVTIASILRPTEWKALIASSAQLSPGEALATTDSLWAAFRAGKAPASWLIDEARAMAANPDANASVSPGDRLSGLRSLGLVPTSSEPAFRSLISSIYAPRLSAIGFNPAFGAYSGDAPDKQQLRQELVSLMAFDAHDAKVRATLKAAGEKYLAGDTKAVDTAFRGSALAVIAEDGGLAEVRKLVETGLSSEDPVLRQAALGAASASGHADAATYLLGLNDKRLRSFDKLMMIGGMVSTPETRAVTSTWIFDNFDKLLASGNGVFITSRLPGMFNAQCSAAAADKVDKVLGPKIMKAKVGVLEYQRTLERIRNCAALKDAKGAEIASAIAAK